MDLYLKDKKVLISGGASGIGRSIAEALAREGAVPILLDRNKETLLQTAAWFEQSNLPMGYAITELTDGESTREALEKLRKSFGPFYGLVNNAGFNDRVGLESGSVADFIRSYQANTVHYYELCQCLLPDLKQQQGAIVNISSKVAETGQGGTSGYAAANGARNALTREWAVELLPFKIRVNAVIVAEALTPLYEKWIAIFDQPDEKLREIEAKIPLGKRMTRPSEIADTVCFLLSERSAHTTGQLIHVDGGYTHLDRTLE